MYLFETHCHTDESSNCGKVPAREVARHYIEAGYDGLVITDHFNVFTLEERPAVLGKPFMERMRLAFLGYHLAKEEAGERLTVLQGVELRFTENINDYLVYGADEAFFYAHPDVFSWGLKKFSAVAREQGFLLVQAHPFRKDMTVMDPSLLDMIEVSNGNPRHDSRNELARLHAKNNGLYGTSGSDYHQLPDLARGGVLLANSPKTVEEFIREMRKGPMLAALNT